MRKKDEMAKLIWAKGKYELNTFMIIFLPTLDVDLYFI